MSDSEGSDSGSGNIHEAQQQATNANSGPLVALEFGDVQIGVTQDGKEDDEPQTGEQDQSKRKANRRLDSSTYDQLSNSITCDKLLLVSEARRRQNVQTGPARVNTAPAHIARVETQQSLVPASANRIQERPVTSSSRQIQIEDAFLGGLCQCKSMDNKWLEGGSLRVFDNNEQILVEKCSRFGDFLRLYFSLNYIIVTNRRFIVKSVWKLFGFNICSDEASHHFDNLQHVSVERGVNAQQLRNKTILFSILAFFSYIPLGSISFITAIQTLLEYLTWIYFGYNILMLVVLYNVNFLVIDIAKANIVGSWNWGTLTRGTSYITIRLPLPVDACFEVMNELLKKHPLLPSPENSV
eukprot:g9095.t1